MTRRRTPTPAATAKIQGAMVVPGELVEYWTPRGGWHVGRVIAVGERGVEIRKSAGRERKPIVVSPSHVRALPAEPPPALALVEKENTVEGRVIQEGADNLEPYEVAAELEPKGGVLAVHAPEAPARHQQAMTVEQVALLKETIAPDADDNELKLFIHIIERTGLDPFAKQIYFMKRWDGSAGKKRMTVVTGIDGYRLTAERTRRYSPGREPSFEYAADAGKRLISATAHIKKQTTDGTWHEVSATAHYNEYVQTTANGQPNSSWTRMPHIMLAKCAEALALRRAFPAELSGLYTDTEMGAEREEEGGERGVPRALPPPPVAPQVREREIAQERQRETAHVSYQMETDQVPTMAQLKRLRVQCDRLNIQHMKSGDEIRIRFPLECFKAWKIPAPTEEEPRWRSVMNGTEMPDVSAKALETALIVMETDQVSAAQQTEEVPF